MAKSLAKIGFLRVKIILSPVGNSVALRYFGNVFLVIKYEPSAKMNKIVGPGNP